MRKVISSCFYIGSPIYVGDHRLKNVKNQAKFCELKNILAKLQSPVHLTGQDMRRGIEIIPPAGGGSLGANGEGLSLGLLS